MMKAIYPLMMFFLIASMEKVQAKIIEIPQGLVIAKDFSNAQAGSIELVEAAKAFEKTFGLEAPKGAVIELGMEKDLPDEMSPTWTLKWDFHAREEIDPERVKDIRNQILEQLSAAGLEPTDEQVNAALNQAKKQLATQKEKDKKTKPLRHEIAHKMFISALWPTEQNSKLSYGGGAPDWLDETAAVAAESEYLTKQRIDEFKQMVKTDSVIPMNQFFSMEHPVHQAARRIVTEIQGSEQISDGVYRLSVEDLEKHGVDLQDLREGAQFYAQCRALLDYLSMNSNKPFILKQITDHLKAGATMAEFFNQHGAALGLAENLPELEMGLKAMISNNQ